MVPKKRRKIVATAGPRFQPRPATRGEDLQNKIKASLDCIAATFIEGSDISNAMDAEAELCARWMNAMG